MYGPLDGPSGSARWHAGLPEAVGYQDNIADDVDGAAEVEVVADVAGRLGLAKVSCYHGNIADEVDVAVVVDVKRIGVDRLVVWRGRRRARAEGVRAEGGLALIAEQVPVGIACGGVVAAVGVEGAIVVFVDFDCIVVAGGPRLCPGLAGVEDTIVVQVAADAERPVWTSLFVRVRVCSVVFGTGAASVRAVRYAVVVVVDIASVTAECAVVRRLGARAPVTVAVCLVSSHEYEGFGRAVRRRGTVVTRASDEVR